MKKLRSVMSLAIIFAGIILFSSCDDGSEEIDIEPIDPPVEVDTTGVLVVNQGNFGQGNGSVSYYDEDQMSISNQVIKNANSENAIGAIIESIYHLDSVGFLVCNAPDKIEFFNLNDYTYLSNPTTSVSQPRYMTIVGDKAYITCWGPFTANYTLEESYVAVMDLSTKEIVNSLECGSGPEGIMAIGNKLFIANSFETSVTVIDLNNDSSSKIDLGAAPQHFALDGSGTLWVSLGSAFGAHTSENVGLQSINTESNSKGAFVQVPNLSDDGVLAIDGAGEKMYVLAAAPWPETDTNVLEFDINAKSLAGDPLVSGKNFIGIGYNVSTDKLYVADAAGFAGNGKIMVYDIDGLLLDEQVTSIGPFHFMFNVSS